MIPALAPSLTAAVRVVYRVHANPPHAGKPSEPAVPSRLPDGYVLMVDIAELSYGGITVMVYAPYLAGGEL
jgi:hypothetical protein